MFRYLLTLKYHYPTIVASVAEMARRQVLIGTAADFCDAFYHVKDTPEAGVTQCCLRAQTGHVCSGKTTCLIAQLSTADGLEQFVRLYRNMAQTSCAEGFLLRDEALMAAVESCGGHTRSGSSNGSTLSLYLTQQPCHFSSSNDDSSCTENLLRWWRDFLEPRGVAHLRIRAAYPYRTHWDEQHMSEDDLASLGRRKWGGGKGGGGKGGKGAGGKGTKGGRRDNGAKGGKDGGSWGGWREGAMACSGDSGKNRAGTGDYGSGSAYRAASGDVSSRIARDESIKRARRMLANAREGTRKLVTQEADGRGVSLAAFDEHDWQFLLGICDDALRRQFEASEAPFTLEVKAKRAKLDAFTKSVFDAYRPEKRSVEECARGTESEVAPRQGASHENVQVLVENAMESAESLTAGERPSCTSCSAEDGPAGPQEIA